MTRCGSPRRSQCSITCRWPRHPRYRSRLGTDKLRGFRTAMDEWRATLAIAQAMIQGARDRLYRARRRILQPARVAIRPRPFAPSVTAPMPHPYRAIIRDHVPPRPRLLIIAQKPWEITEAELRDYRARFLAMNGRVAPKPLIASFIAVHETQAGARDMFENTFAAMRGRRSTITNSTTRAWLISPDTNITASSRPTSASMASTLS